MEKKRFFSMVLAVTMLCTTVLGGGIMQASATQVPNDTSSVVADAPSPESTPATNAPSTESTPAINPPSTENTPATNPPSPESTPATNPPSTESTPATDAPSTEGTPATDAPSPEGAAAGEFVFAISDFTIAGVVGQEIEPIEVTLTSLISGEGEALVVGGNYTEFFREKVITNLPRGITIKGKGSSPNNTVATFTVTGVPVAAAQGVGVLGPSVVPNSNVVIDITLPAEGALMTIDDFRMSGFIGEPMDKPVMITIYDNNGTMEAIERVVGTDYAQELRQGHILNFPQGLNAICKSIAGKNKIVTYEVSGTPVALIQETAQLSDIYAPNANAYFSFQYKDTLSDFDITGVVGTAITPIDVSLSNTPGRFYEAFTIGADYTEAVKAELFYNLPAGLMVSVKAYEEDGSAVTFTFSGTPTEAFAADLDIADFIAPANARIRIFDAIVANSFTISDFSLVGTAGAAITPVEVTVTDEVGYFANASLVEGEVRTALFKTLFVANLPEGLTVTLTKLSNKNTTMVFTIAGTPTIAANETAVLGDGVVPNGNAKFEIGAQITTPTPTPIPTTAPTVAPTAAPTVAPTVAPTAAPTAKPGPATGDTENGGLVLLFAVSALAIVTFGLRKRFEK